MAFVVTPFARWRFPEDVLLDCFLANAASSCRQESSEVVFEAMPPRVRERLLGWQSSKIEAHCEILPRLEVVGELVIAVLARVLVEKYSKDGFELVAVTRRSLVSILEGVERKIEAGDNAREMVFVLTEVAGLVDDSLNDRCEVGGLGVGSECQGPCLVTPRPST